MAVNPQTYADIASTNLPHGAGEIWASALWDMNWLLINGDDGQLPALGFDADLYEGTGGNNVALQLVMDGLKLQPANPSFLDARDAVLLADNVLTGGANNLAIWTAFARRGMGFSAGDGGSANSLSVTEEFDMPATSAGLISFDAEEYEIGDPITIQIRDLDLTGTGPLAVEVQSSGGDLETFGLFESPTALGVFEVTVDAIGANAVADNGVLEVGFGDVLRIAYEDADDGSGNGSLVTDTAEIIFVLEQGGDLYQIDLVLGDTLRVSTATPADNPAATPRNDLDPGIVVLDPAGFPVAADADSLDGKNALIRFQAAETGTYVIQVLRDDGVGEYVLGVAFLPPGDMNGDGGVDFDDVDALLLALRRPDSYSDEYYGLSADTLGDLDADGDLDFDDVRPFVELLGSNPVLATAAVPAAAAAADTAAWTTSPVETAVAELFAAHRHERSPRQRAAAPVAPAVEPRRATLHARMSADNGVLAHKQPGGGASLHARMAADRLADDAAGARWHAAERDSDAPWQDDYDWQREHAWDWIESVLGASASVARRSAT